VVILVKRFFIAVILLAFASTAHAGFIGWVTSKERSWEYVQQTGGIRIGQPVEREGKLTLPVDYDASGTAGITVRPTVTDSGQAVRRVAIRRGKGDQLILTVVTQVVEETSNAGRLHHADLSHIAAGTYDVFYGKGGDPEKHLGRVTIH
jgi:hypothetical protein